MKIEVGKTYIMRNGETAKILRSNSNHWPFIVIGYIGQYLHRWTEDGEFYGGGRESCYDILAEQGVATAEAAVPLDATIATDVNIGVATADGQSVIVKLIGPSDQQFVMKPNAALHLAQRLIAAVAEIR